MEFSENALVLKVGRFKEADMWVRFFTPTRGVLTAFAFGGCKSRRRFCGCLDALNQVRFRVKSNRAGTYLCLMEGSLLKTPAMLRQDTTRMGLMANCIKFVEAAFRGPDGANTIHGLLVDALDVLDGEQEVSNAFPMLFRAKMLCELGFGPNLQDCCVCGAKLDTVAAPQFLISEGRLTCGHCRGRSSGNSLSVSAGALKTLDFIRSRGPEQWRRLALDPPVRREFAEMVDSAITYHLGLNWDRGAFRRV
ncbi:MAG: DNA repair protein RecO [Desulfovibrio sp.]|nr:MAG: DNA repair protein RecO [Desulfovibrio sp.]